MVVEYRTRLTDLLAPSFVKNRLFKRFFALWVVFEKTIYVSFFQTVNLQAEFDIKLYFKATVFPL